MSPMRVTTGWVLLVEDDAFFRELVEDMLRGGGYPVRSAGNGIEALQMVRDTTDPPALIIVDMMMPIVDGFEVIRVVRGDAVLKHVPLLAISSSSLASTAGDEAFLQKPFTARQLLGKVEELLDGDTVVEVITDDEEPTPPAGRPID